MTRTGLAGRLGGWPRGLLSAVLAVVLTCPLAGCGSDPPTPGGVQVRISGTKSLPADEFVAILATPAQVARLVCPGSALPLWGAHCAAGGFALDTVPKSLHVLVKSRGLQTLERDLTGSASLQLVAMPEPVVDPNYATALAKSAGVAAYSALAYPASTELGPTESVKFFVRKLDTDHPEVYFQATKTNFLHYAFAHDVLHMPGTNEAFEQVTYHGQTRSQAAGTLVRYGSVQAAPLAGGIVAQTPVTMTFFPSDDIGPALAARLHRLVEERLGFVRLGGGADRLVYLPAGDQQEAAAHTSEHLLAAADVPWLDRKSLYGGLKLQVMNPGIAYGTLRRLTPEQLPTAIVSWTDILLLTRLPNALPIVGGTLVEELQTPLAHVNVAAHTRGLPNVSLLGASTDPRVQPYLGQLVRFEAKDGDFTIKPATLQEAKAWWQNTKKTPFVPEHDDAFAGLPDLASVGFGDWQRIGVKAANVAELSHFVGEHAPTGFAVPFHYYLDFVQHSAVTAELCQSAYSHCVSSGRAAVACSGSKAFCDLPGAASETLEQHALRLSQDAALAADSPTLEAALDSLVFLFSQLPIDPTLATALDGEVAKRFGTAKVRLRSSTNSEDLPGFSGAGLYDSLSATAAGKNAASLRIRNIWGSVWTWRAYQERQWWSIAHSHVRMAVLVHQSFPDEQANGVLISQNIADLTVQGMYVNVQKGEVSVTNPTDGAVAEVFAMMPGPAGLTVQRLRYSSLSPGQAILSDAEALLLYQTASQVQEHFAPLYKKSPQQLALDMEFKFHGPTRALYIKQVRPYVSTE